MMRRDKNMCVGKRCLLEDRLLGLDRRRKAGGRGRGISVEFGRGRRFKKESCISSGEVY